VVGYAALAYVADEPQTSEHEDARGTVLLAHARHAIETLFERRDGRALPEAPFLDEPGATFVTLRRHGDLRGCIGSLEADRALRVDVARNARAAALHDPRFEPLAEIELEGLSIEVSLLSPPQPLDFRDEHDLLRQLAEARDGVVLEAGRFRSTFLPQVWEQLPDKTEFFSHLAAKAGCAPSAWRGHGVSVSTYRVEAFAESR